MCCVVTVFTLWNIESNKSKCCPALPGAWVPANAGTHGEPLYSKYTYYGMKAVRYLFQSGKSFFTNLLQVSIGRDLGGSIGVKELLCLTKRKLSWSKLKVLSDKQTRTVDNPKRVSSRGGVNEVKSL